MCSAVLCETLCHEHFPLLCSAKFAIVQCVLHGRDGMGVGVGLCRYTQGLGEVEWKLRVIGWAGIWMYWRFKSHISEQYSTNSL